MHLQDKYHSPTNYRLDDDHPGRAALRKGRCSLPNHAYFVTKCTDDPDFGLLATSAYATIIIGSLRWLVQSRYARCCGFVVMPDHYHVGLGLLETRTLSEVMASLNRFTSRQINAVLKRKGRFWEPGYYDHAIRNRSDLDEVLAYMHENPVSAGLAERAEAWEYSTANPKYADMIDWEWLGHSILW
ncbi:MAG: hypothetical protein FJ279_29960 [Planctomycetes bacterium]|nr:hypothetical protein [Planctomycetota bacterium]